MLLVEWPTVGLPALQREQPEQQLGREQVPVLLALGLLPMVACRQQPPVLLSLPPAALLVQGEESMLGPVLPEQRLEQQGEPGESRLQQVLVGQPERRLEPLLGQRSGQRL